MPTYTHVGRLARVGHQHYGRHFEHWDTRRGSVHALNRVGYEKYRAVCGVIVELASSNSHDQGGENPIDLAGTRPVTCRRCRAAKPEAVPYVPARRPVWVVMVEGDGGAVRYASCDTQDQAARMSLAVEAKDGRRSWVEPGEVVTY